jgi:putative component of membrane protein insertase Oxa1/YidC/SpoIIIJ protein YidD
MQVYSFDTFGRNICVACISGYQKYLSPHKGFACAHRLLYGEESCSQYIKKVVAREGIRVAIEKSRVRFQECKQASQVLRAHRLNSRFKMSSETSEEGQKANKRKKYIDNRCADGMTDVCDCIEPGCEVVDCAFTDYSGLDCSFPDCSGLDCNILDCGCGG